MKVVTCSYQFVLGNYTLLMQHEYICEHGIESYYSYIHYLFSPGIREHDDDFISGRLIL